MRGQVRFRCREDVKEAGRAEGQSRVREQDGAGRVAGRAESEGREAWGRKQLEIQGQGDLRG